MLYHIHIFLGKNDLFKNKTVESCKNKFKLHWMQSLKSLVCIQFCDNVDQLNEGSLIDLLFKIRSSDVFLNAFLFDRFPIQECTFS